MTIRRLALSAVICVLIQAFAAGQTRPSTPAVFASPTAAPAKPAAASTTLAPLAAGTPVWVRLAQSLSTRTAHVGNAVRFQVLEDVTTPGGAVVIRKGAPAYGHVAEARAARRLSRRGKLDIAIDAVESVTGERIVVSAQQQAQGPGSTEMLVGKMFFTTFMVGAPVASLWLLQHGKNMELPAGAAFNVFTSRATEVDLQKTQPPADHDPLLSYQLAFLRGDAEAMEKQVEAARGLSGSDDLLLAAQADTEAYYGHFSKARDLTQQAMEAALHAGRKDTAAIWQAKAALNEAEVGYAANARGDVAAALKLSSSKDVETLAALALARAGDAKQAEKLATKLHDKFKEDTELKVYWLPTIRASIELTRGKPADALVALQSAAAHAMDTASPLQTGSLYPVYVRGQALAALRRADAASAEFGTIVRHPGMVVNSPLGALARLQLARAYQVQGDTTKMCAAYRDFFTLWKDADADVAMVEQAKQESKCQPQ